MDKKLVDIYNYIEESSNDFNNHFDTIVSSSSVLDFIKDIKSRTQVYLFSGLIRDYFLNKNDGIRDIDLIIEDDLAVEQIYSEFDIYKNSFGGYKIIIDNTTIDLWAIKNTWGLNYGQLNLSFGYLNHLPETTFFNFSSILFSLNNKEFIVGKNFLEFLNNKKLDVVLEANPFPELCIVNTFYYSEKFNLKLSKNLKEYIIKNYNKYHTKINDAQINHFQNILYTEDDMLRRVNELV